MKKVVSIGKIEEVKIPSNLAYRGAVEKLVKDATGTGITIDLASFYSKEPIELHNFVDTITYRFVTEGKEEFLAYFICSRPNEIYREVKFDGSVILSNVSDIEVPVASISTDQVAVRMKNTLAFKLPNKCVQRTAKSAAQIAIELRQF
jgi:hypothetical protein